MNDVRIQSEMSDTKQHELAILTNDGWVVALKSDRPIDIGDSVVSSIIVQPVEDYRKRVEGEPNELRREYRLTRAGQVNREPWTSGTGTPVNRVANVTE